MGAAACHRVGAVVAPEDDLAVLPACRKAIGEGEHGGDGTGVAAHDLGGRIPRPSDRAGVEPAREDARAVDRERAHRAAMAAQILRRRRERGPVVRAHVRPPGAPASAAQFCGPTPSAARRPAQSRGESRPGAPASGAPTRRVFTLTVLKLQHLVYA